MIGRTVGSALTHPAFRDVYFILLKKFYIPEKREWKLKVRWMHKRGDVLGDDKLRISDAKYREFKPYEEG